MNHRYAAKRRFRIWAVTAVRLLIPFGGFSDNSGGEADSFYSSVAEDYRRQQTYPRFEIAVPQRLVKPINGPVEIAPEKAVSPLSIISCIWARGR